MQENEGGVYANSLEKIAGRLEGWGMSVDMEVNGWIWEIFRG